MKRLFYGSLIVSALLTVACLQSSAAAPGGGAGAGRGGAMGGFGGGGGGGFGSTRPSIQGGDKSLKAHQDLLTKAKIGKGKIDVYFEGDSIMRRWAPDPAVERSYAKFYANWKENFWGWNAADFGWGTDLVQNILWRLQNGELDDVNPKVVVFLGGTNNLQPGGNDNNVNDITAGLTACFDTIHKKAPDATLIIIGILPRQTNYLATVDKINANLQKLADGKKTRFVSLKDKFVDASGNLLPGMTVDNLHPDVKGYQAIADAIKPILTEVLGPPAKDDHAPPPTWDPSASEAPKVYPPPAATEPATKP